MRRATFLAAVALVTFGCGDEDNASPVNHSVDVLTADADADDAMDALGTFTLHHDPVLNCLYHDEPDNNAEPGTGGRIVIVWPAGYTAVADDNEVAVLDATGSPVARTNVAFRIGGGGLPADTDHCNAIGVWVASGPPIAPTPANTGENDDGASRVGSDLPAESDSLLDSTQAPDQRTY